MRAAAFAPRSSALVAITFQSGVVRVAVLASALAVVVGLVSDPRPSSALSPAAPGVEQPGVEQPGVAQPGGGEDGVAGRPPRVEVRLQEAHAPPGAVATMRVGLRTERPLALLAWSLEYDPVALELVEPPELSRALEQLRERAEPASSFRFEWFLDELAGRAQFLLVTDFSGLVERAIPVGLMATAVTLRFHVRAETELGRYPITFTDAATAEYGGEFVRDGEPIYNAAREAGEPFVLDDAFDGAVDVETWDGAVIAIIGDVGFFLRGDANLDAQLDVSDALTILDGLFLGGPPPACDEVADANLDGSVDLSDPVAILGFLFQGTRDEALVEAWTAGAATEDAVECPLAPSEPR